MRLRALARTVALTYAHARRLHHRQVRRRPPDEQLETDARSGAGVVRLLAAAAQLVVRWPSDSVRRVRRARVPLLTRAPCRTNAPPPRARITVNERAAASRAARYAIWGGSDEPLITMACPTLFDLSVKYGLPMCAAQVSFAPFFFRFK